MTDATNPSLSDSAKPQQFTVRAVEGNGVEVLLDGTDIASKVSRLHMDLSAGLPFAEVVLILNPQHTVSPEFDGLAHVQIGDQVDPGPAAATFLAAIDPEALEQAAFNRDDLGTEPHSGTKAMLAQLIDWANGRT